MAAPRGWVRWLTKRRRLPDGWTPNGLVAGVLTVTGVGILGPVVVVLLVLVLFQGSVSCDFDFDANTSRPDRTTCEQSARPLVRASVEPGGSAVARRLRAGDRPDATDSSGNRALACAAMVGNLAAVQRLLAAKASATETGSTGGRPIVAAVSGEGRDGNAPEDDKAIHFESVYSTARLEIVRDLVAHGAAASDALAPAAEKGYLAMVNLLLQLGADPNGVTGQPSPLLEAVLDGSLPVTVVLLAHHADPNHAPVLPSEDVLAALSIDPVNGQPDASVPDEALLEQLGSVPASGPVPPLVAAALPNLSAEELSALLDAGADVNGLAFGQYSALWVAAATRNYAAALILKARGALDQPPGSQHSAAGTAFTDHDPQMYAILTHA